MTTVDFNEEALKRGVASVRHPLTRALLALTFTTGFVDAVSYLGLGHVFTANMTGNVVLLGFGLAGSGGLPVLAPTLSLAAFVLGAAAGGWLVRRYEHPDLVSWALTVEVVLVTVAGILAAAVTISAGRPGADTIIVLLAFAMGVRAAAVRRIGVPDLSTVVLTMTLTALASGATFAGGEGTGSVRRASAALAMFAGALVGALLLKLDVWVPLAVAAALALVIRIAYVPVAVRRGASG